MKRILVVLALLLVTTAQAAPANTSSAKSPAPVAPAAQPPAPKFDFQGVNVAQVIALLYGEVLKQPYVLDPNVLGDQRLVSFRFDASKGELLTFLRAFLDSLGFAIETRGGVDFVTVRPTEQKGPVLELFVYRPQYRELAYLTELLGPLFKSKRPALPPVLPCRIC